MLTEEDILLIEKVRDNELEHPDAVPLTAEEKETFKERMKDPKFKSHFKFSSQIDVSLENEDVIDFRSKLQSASKGYHRK